MNLLICLGNLIETIASSFAGVYIAEGHLMILLRPFITLLQEDILLVTDSVILLSITFLHGGKFRCQRLIDIVNRYF